jgi:hypothetical protein
MSREPPQRSLQSRTDLIRGVAPHDAGLRGAEDAGLAKGDGRQSWIHDAPAAGFAGQAGLETLSSVENAVGSTPS